MDGRSMTIHDLTTYAGQYAHIKAVKARLNAGKPKPKPLPLEITKTVKVKQSEYFEIPTWKLQKLFFDDHVIRWQIRGFSVPSDWLKNRCIEIGVEYKDMVGYKRARVFSIPRQRLMYEVNKEFPHLSLPQIGRMFGQRDHTTILHGLRAHEERMNANDI